MRLDPDTDGFKAAFGDHWEDLAPVLKAHYANKPFSRDSGRADGRLAVTISPLVRLFAPLVRWSGTLISRAGDNVAVTVDFNSEPESNMLSFDRRFDFGEGRVETFVSWLEPLHGGAIEWTATGIGWHSDFRCEDGRLNMVHRAFCLRVFGRRIRLPLEFFVGRPFAFEAPVSDTQFDMEMHMRHWLFGDIYRYKGRFTMVRSPINSEPKQ